MERLHLYRSQLLSLGLGLLLAALPALAFAQTSSSDDGAAAFAVVLVIYCLCGLIWLGIAAAIAYWVYRDAKKRNNPNAVIWAIVSFFFHVIGLLLYFVLGRNQGMTPPPAGPTGPSTTVRY